MEEGLWNVEGEANSMWEEMATWIRKVATKVFGVTRGTRHKPKDTWWWNEDMQKAIKEKNECYKYLHHYRSEDNVQKYKSTKKNAKRAASEARGRTYEHLYQKQVRRRAKRTSTLRERKTRDFNQVKCIKDETNRFLVKRRDKEQMERILWQVVQWRKWEHHDWVGWLIWWYQ